MTEGGRVVVAGAGLAGLRTVEELRARGYAGRITLVGAEHRPPYDRPPLSKKVLTERVAPDPSLRADFAALDVDFRPGETAEGLDVVAPAATSPPLAISHATHPYPAPLTYARLPVRAVTIRLIPAMSLTGKT